MSSFGVWAMWIFWGSAIGGIALGIAWARSKGKNPASRQQILRSLKQRLESGEITQGEYESKIYDLDRRR